MTEAIKKNGVNFGVILAVYFVLRSTLMYSIDLKLFTNGWISLIDLIVCISLSVVAISKAKKALGGYITFKDAFVVYFINVLISFAVYTTFIIVLFNVIDPEAKEIVHKFNIEKAVEGLQNFGVDTAKIKETVQNMENNNTFSVKNQLMGFPIGLGISCVVGLIIAAIMKKNRPYEMPSAQDVNKIGAE